MHQNKTTISLKTKKGKSGAIQTCNTTLYSIIRKHDTIEHLKRMYGSSKEREYMGKVTCCTS